MISLPPLGGSRLFLILLILTVSLLGRIEISPPQADLTASPRTFAQRVHFKGLNPLNSKLLIGVILVLGTGLERPVLRILTMKYLGVDVDKDHNHKLSSEEQQSKET